MVNMTTYIKNTLLLCLMFCATIFVGCSDDDNNGVTPLPEYRMIVVRKHQAAVLDERDDQFFSALGLERIRGEVTSGG